MGDTCTLSFTVIGTTVNQFEFYIIITNSTLLPEAICCCLQTSTYCCFYQGGEIYVYKLSFTKPLYFLVIWTHVLLL